MLNDKSWTSNSIKECLCLSALCFLMVVYIILFFGQLVPVPFNRSLTLFPTKFMSHKFSKASLYLTLRVFSKYPIPYSFLLCYLPQLYLLLVCHDILRFYFWSWWPISLYYLFYFLFNIFRFLLNNEIRYHYRSHIISFEFSIYLHFSIVFISSCSMSENIRASLW